MANKGWSKEVLDRIDEEGQHMERAVKELEQEMSELPIMASRGAENFVSRVGRRTDSVAEQLRHMNYGEYMKLMQVFSGGDEVLQDVLAKRLWAWAIDYPPAGSDDLINMA